MSQRQRRPGQSPSRRCIATGETDATTALIRFVLSPDGVVTPDFSGKLPGRGAWVKADKSALDVACNKGSFARAFRAEAKLPDGATAMAEMVEAGLARRALELLGLARRSGDIILGFEKIRIALRAGKAALLIGAADGAADGRSKLRALAKATPVVSVFSVAELSAAMGVDNAVHVAFKEGPVASRFLRAARRVEGFRANASG